MRAAITVTAETEFGNECEIKFQMFPDKMLLHLESVPDLVEYVVIAEEDVDSLHQILSAIIRARELTNDNGN